MEMKFCNAKFRNGHRCSWPAIVKQKGPCGERRLCQLHARVYAEHDGVLALIRSFRDRDIV